MGQLVTAEIVSVVQVSDAVLFINQKAQAVQVNMMEIGEFVFDKFFKNDLSKVFSKDPYKNVSFAKLAEHPDLLIDRSTLGRCVGLHIQKTKMLEYDEKSATLLQEATPTHQKILLPVNEPELKVKLLKTALKNNLSSREFRDLVREEKKSNRSNRGRKSIPQLQKNWRKCFRAIEPDEETFSKHRVAFLAENNGTDEQTKDSWLHEIEEVIRYLHKVKDVVSSIK